MNLIEELGVHIPKNTKVQAKAALNRMIERMILHGNYPLVLNQRNPRYTKEQIEKALLIGELNPSIFVVERSSSKNSYLAPTTWNRLMARPATTMCLTEDAYSKVHQFKKDIQLRLSRDGDEEARLNLYFDQHDYRVNGVKQTRWVTVSNDNRIVHPMTNLPRGDFSVHTENGEVQSLEFPKSIGWSIDGDENLVLLDYQAFAPTVISSINNTVFKDYPEIEGFTRDQVKKIFSAVRQGSRDRVTNELKRVSRPKQIDGLGEHSCSLSNAEVLEIIYDSCPALLLPLELIKKQYIDAETSLLREIIRQSMFWQIGIVPLHDGVIVPKKAEYDYVDLMSNLGSEFKLKVVSKPIEKSTKPIYKVTK